MRRDDTTGIVYRISLSSSRLVFEGGGWIGGRRSGFELVERGSHDARRRLLGGSAGFAKLAKGLGEGANHVRDVFGGRRGAPAGG